MIKNIIFDFGDIFVNLDKPATLREMEKHNISGFSGAILQKNLAYEKGLITSEEFLKAYGSEYNLEKDVVVNSWNAILIDFPEHRFEFIKELSASNQYRLFLLSNTNEIHIDWIKKNVPFFEDFKNCFDAFYLSHEINFRKPDAAIYKFVLDAHNLKPEECLFIDDTKENTDAATSLGLQTWHLDPASEDVTDLFTIKKELF
ncbi:HAD family phosphatase [Antarcticibacterium arcticum]|uniref:HAD family phosphatase n=1 Tax=Antarcticibacterium arcticum TaxID=2585771 RepID=A0A5B8YJ04_9FLAO|nr:HAD family phosphatase [Antarcticibacterium arcticum]QED36376.1 HAD family phosphatase [Antarcticibacterium arcticum]